MRQFSWNIEWDKFISGSSINSEITTVCIMCLQFIGPESKEYALWLSFALLITTRVRLHFSLLHFWFSCGFFIWFQDSGTGTPVTMRVDAKGFFLYWVDQNNELDILDIATIRDVRTGQYAKRPKVRILLKNASVAYTWFLLFSHSLGSWFLGFVNRINARWERAFFADFTIAFIRPCHNGLYFAGFSSLLPWAAAFTAATTNFWNAKIKKEITLF